MKAIKIDTFIEDKRQGLVGEKMLPSDKYVTSVDKVFITLESSLIALSKVNHAGTILIHSLFASEL